MTFGVELIENKMDKYFNEIWRDVVGYEGYYMVSNNGRIVRPKRLVVNRLGVHHIVRGGERKQVPTHDGYLSVGLHMDGIKKTMRVHRIVAEAFIPNPMSLETVNHKDGNKENNCVLNLEWMTRKENCKHAYRTGLSTPPCIGRFNELHPMSKAIHQYSIDGDYLQSFPSASEASRAIGANVSHISDFASRPKNRIHAYGYKWSYEKRDKF